VKSFIWLTDLAMWSVMKAVCLGSIGLIELVIGAPNVNNARTLCYFTLPEANLGLRSPEPTGFSPFSRKLT
jgi:hypothetical protein